MRILWSLRTHCVSLCQSFVPMTPSLHGVPSARFPRFNGTTSHYDFLPCFPVGFVILRVPGTASSHVFCGPLRRYSDSGSLVSHAGFQGLVLLYPARQRGFPRLRHGKISHVPRLPSCLYALFSDPGRTLPSGSTMVRYCSRPFNNESSHK